MPELPSRPPQLPPWESSWAPDGSRVPGTRRLWLAGALALAVVVATVTAISAGGDRSGEASPAERPPLALADGPGLLSLVSAPASASASPKPLSGTPSAPATPTASATTRRDGPAPASTAPAAPAESAPGHGTSPDAPRPSATWVSLRSVNYPDRYWQVSDGLVKLGPAGSGPERREATFRLAGGLADASCHSFATADGGYLRHRGFLLRAEPDDGSVLFRQDATFCPRVSAHAGAVVLESVNHPGRFLRHQNFQLRLDPYQSGDLYVADSAFRLVDGLA
ncbi:AbfB domain-containing protein [Streptomyces kebangsaanensis]|uniref:AbfB domain-containing protein n=1 Tax=Streptomyces kebangsaanensis TaxID=864058 RepID=A0ABW6KQ96_9ACTN